MKTLSPDQIDDVDVGSHSVAPKKAAFLKAFEASGGNLVVAERAAKVSRRSHYRWLKQPEYQRRFEEATARALEIAEKEAWRRAVEGLVRYKFGPKGEPIMHPVTGEPYYELEYSDTLLIFTLKALNPQKYRDTTRHEIANADGKAFKFTLSIDASDG